MAVRLLMTFSGRTPRGITGCSPDSGVCSSSLVPSVGLRRMLSGIPIFPMSLWLNLPSNHDPVRTRPK